jgi:hypothetical protein
MQLHTSFAPIRHRTDYYSKKDLGCPKAFLTIVLTYIFLELLWRIPKRAKDNHRLIGWIIDHLGTYLCHRKKIVMQIFQVFGKTLSSQLKLKENGNIVYFTSKLFPTLQKDFLIHLVDTIFSE